MYITTAGLRRFWLKNNHPSHPIFSWPNTGPNTGVKRNLRKSHQFPHPAAAFGRFELALQKRHDCSENMSGGAQPTARRAGGGGHLVRNGAQLVLTGTFIRPPRTSLNPPLHGGGCWKKNHTNELRPLEKSRRSERFLNARRNHVRKRRIPLCCCVRKINK